MKVKFPLSTLAILLAMLTVFTLDTVADTESASNQPVEPWVLVLVIVLIVICIWLATRKERVFLKEHSDLLWSKDPKVLLELIEKCNEYLKDRQSDKVANLSRHAKEDMDDILEDIFLKEHSDLLSSEDPKVLLELIEKCNEYLKDRRSTEVTHLLQQTKDKAARVQREINFQANLETFKSEISQDGSHPAVVSTLKEQMHNPDSFQHVSSDYEIVEKDGKHYQKIVMSFRGTNTYNALVLQTCYFIVDADNQVSLVASQDDTESSPVPMVALAASTDSAASAIDGAAALAASADDAASAVEDILTLADMLSFFISDEG